ncbi:MAG: 7-cyano-7-deazaguanine synthase [Candidatus Aminicenantes bacterium]|nr:7-cyano-7-deazaguanine synthase [Candidatus Aminicenantes bacterium]
METKKFIQEKVKEIKETVGDKKALVALSGGVDSSTTTVLAHQALGKRLIPVFIDDGLMRAGEARRVKDIFKKLGIKVRIVIARREFFNVTATDPEVKRRKFRRTFYRMLGKLARRYKAKFLLQGTILTDIEETKRGVKTQHNVLEQMGIKPKRFGLPPVVIEPLKDLRKDEVREVAKELGLPAEIYDRMPFPGPGFSTRVLGKLTPQRVNIVRKANNIVEEELAQFKPFQAFAVLLSDRATGMKKGKRVYGNIIIIRSVESTDARTATPSQIPWEVLQKIQQRICTEVRSVSRVLYDLTPKEPATIEYI